MQLFKLGLLLHIPEKQFQGTLRRVCSWLIKGKELYTFVKVCFPVHTVCVENALLARSHCTF